MVNKEVSMSKQDSKDQQLEAVAVEAVRKLRRPPRPTGALKPERIQEELRTMSAWKLMPDGKTIGHTRGFAQASGAAKFATFVAELAAVDRQPVHLGISGNRVLLTLPHRNGTSGLTAAVFDFARQLG
jgi:pterin-4a-carbinolamine dehydratase